MKPRRASLITLLVILLSCLGVQKCPKLETSPLDRAVIACLDTAWSITTILEVAGGVVFNAEGELVCTQVTLGGTNTVRFVIYPEWLAHYHTHPIEVQSSLDDKENVEDKKDSGRGRPSYIRTPSGTVWVYECLFSERDGVDSRECQERLVRYSN